MTPLQQFHYFTTKSFMESVKLNLVTQNPSFDSKVGNLLDYQLNAFYLLGRTTWVRCPDGNLPIINMFANEDPSNSVILFTDDKKKDNYITKDPRAKISLRELSEHSKPLKNSLGEFYSLILVDNAIFVDLALGLPKLYEYFCSPNIACQFFLLFDQEE